MAVSKVILDADQAVADITDGAVIMVAGYAGPGTPQNLVKAVLRKGVGRLTCISGPWCGGDAQLYGAGRLVASGQVTKVVRSPRVYPGSGGADLSQTSHDGMETEYVPQGVLVERIRAGGAGLGGVFLSLDPGANGGDGKEKRVINGDEYVLEMPIKADFALLCAHKADTLGNLVYRLAQRNWNPIMAMAADVTIVEVDEVVQIGDLDPELVITPGIYVDRLVVVGGVP